MNKIFSEIVFVSEAIQRDVTNTVYIYIYIYTCFATNRKAAVSIPAGVIGIFH